VFVSFEGVRRTLSGQNEHSNSVTFFSISFALLLYVSKVDLFDNKQIHIENVRKKTNGHSFSKKFEAASSNVIGGQPMRGHVS